MPRPLYDHVEVEMSLRDRLALDRTKLASRRTALAIGRTSLALFVSGASFVKFFDEPWLHGVGIAFMVLAAPVGLLGLWRERKRQKEYRRLEAMARRTAAPPTA